MAASPPKTKLNPDEVINLIAALTAATGIAAIFLSLCFLTFFRERCKARQMAADLETQRVRRSTRDVHRRERIKARLSKHSSTGLGSDEGMGTELETISEPESERRTNRAQQDSLARPEATKISRKVRDLEQAGDGANTWSRSSPYTPPRSMPAWTTDSFGQTAIPSAAGSYRVATPPPSYSSRD